MRTIIVACIAFLLLTCAANADPRFHGGRVFVASQVCTGHVYRPASIILACGDGGLFATSIRYARYGGATADATAELNTHSCQPNCAESAFHAFPGSLVLADVVRCQGTLFYSRARYRFADGGPYGEPSSGVADIEPFEHCSTVLG
jgi:hypothetical protein